MRKWPGVAVAVIAFAVPSTAVAAPDLTISATHARPTFLRATAPNTTVYAGSLTVTVANQGAGVLSVPLVATAEADSKLVVEIFLPDAAGGGNLIFPGSNADGQSGPSYLRAPAAGCDLVEPTDLADIGFPEMHLVVSVAGTAY